MERLAGDLHYPHVRRGGGTGEVDPIEWGEPWPPGLRERLIAFTCPCRDPQYELLAAGGAFWIRRGGDRPAETPRMVAAAARDLWERLLAGRCR